MDFPYSPLSPRALSALLPGPAGLGGGLRLVLVGRWRSAALQGLDVRPELVHVPQPLPHLGNVGLVIERVGAQAQAVLEAAEADPDAFLETHLRGSFSETRFWETVLRDC
jgi:hypothetical protein